MRENIKVEMQVWGHPGDPEVPHPPSSARPLRVGEYRGGARGVPIPPPRLTPATACVRVAPRKEREMSAQIPKNPLRAKHARISFKCLDEKVR